MEATYEKVQGVFNKVIYPRDCPLNYKGYMLALYNQPKTAEEIEKSRVRKGGYKCKFKVITIAGEGLPTTPKIPYEFEGMWEEDKAKRKKFVSKSYSQVGAMNRSIFIAQYTHPPYEGIGATLAARIWDIYGEEIFTILDECRDISKEVIGLSKVKWQKFLDSYISNSMAEGFGLECKKIGLSSQEISKLYNYAGKSVEEAKRIITENPYALPRICNLNFELADKYAKANGFEDKNPNRVEAAAEYLLKRYIQAGNICMGKKNLCMKLLKYLQFGNTKENTDCIIQSIKMGVDNNFLSVYDGSVFLPFICESERVLAARVVNKMMQKPYYRVKNIDEAIKKEEETLGFGFADKQIESIRVALSDNCFTIITGGPGTGKSTIMRGILDIYKFQNPDARIVCCAPTGKAARRLTESTGMKASTVHSALGITAYYDGSFTEEREKLDADLIVVDEVSMLDNIIAERFFDSLEKGAKVVFVGDSDQLASVGAGSVLYDLIESGAVPVVKLDKVYRQAAESLIAVNAFKMNHGETDLKYGSDFEFIETEGFDDPASIIMKEYVKYVKELGVDGVSLLCPYRNSGDVCVNRLNKLAQYFINPHEEGKNELNVEGHGRCLTFRVGDRVMQTQNCEGVMNGDIGTIVDIVTKDGRPAMHIDFDGKKEFYAGEKLFMLDLAYALTVHKSQGSEYHTVLVCIENAHKRLLSRSLIYTAVTRGKKKVVLIGNKSAIDYSIENGTREERETKLLQRIQDYVPDSTKGK